MAGVDATTETRSLFGSLVALVPDVAFAVARDVQRRTVSVVRATSRVPVAVITTVFESAPMQAPLEVVETQLRPIAARGAEQRRQDVENARSMMTRMEPTLNVFLEKVVELLPIDALLARVDVDALIKRVDVDDLIKRVDVDDIVARVDVAGLVTNVLEGIELGDLIQDSTTSVVGDARDGVRVRVITADGRFAGLVDRLLLRKRERDLLLPGFQPSGAT